MPVEVRPVTVFEDTAAVLGPRNPESNACWCLSYRLPSSGENQFLQRRARGERVRELLAEDLPPGVLAYDGGEPAGWAAIHPRADTSFATNRRIPLLDDLPVWSVLNGFPRVLMRLALWTDGCCPRTAKAPPRGTGGAWPGKAGRKSMGERILPAGRIVVRRRA